MRVTMKALRACALPAAASAQYSVTLFGAVDLSVQHVRALGYVHNLPKRTAA